MRDGDGRQRADGCTHEQPEEEHEHLPFRIELANGFSEEAEHDLDEDLSDEVRQELEQGSRR